MKRIFHIAAFLVAATGAAFAQGALVGINGDCTVGGQQTLTSGMPSTGTRPIGSYTVSTNAGIQASYPKCQVTVYASGTLNLSPLYANNAVTPTVLSNPFTANTNGSYTFFVTGSTCYDIVLSTGSGPALPANKTLTDVCPVSVCPNCLSFNPLATQTITQPNVNGVQTSLNVNVANNVVIVGPPGSGFDFTVTPTYPTVLIAGSNTVTLANVPLGVNGTNTVANSKGHWIQVVSAVGDPNPSEFVLITGGTALSGGTNETLSFTTAFSHIAGYNLKSASTGIQEAIWVTNSPGVSLQLTANISNYQCNAPIYAYQNDIKINGQWARLIDNSFGPCLVLGGGGPLVIGGSFAGELTNLDVRNGAVQGFNLATTEGIIDGTSATHTATVASCPYGFYAAQPWQILWIDGTYTGEMTTPFGYGEPVYTIPGGTCAPGMANGTIAFEILTLGQSTLSTHDSGYHISNMVSPMIEQACSTNCHIHDVRFATGVSSSAGQGGYYFQIDEDQACNFDNITANAGYALRPADADFQSAGWIMPNGNGTICNFHNINFTGAAVIGYGIEDWAGNDLNIGGDSVFQSVVMANVLLGVPRGGFGRFFIDCGVHFEQGSVGTIYGVPLGVPWMEILGSQSPVNNCSGYVYPNVMLSTTNNSSWPVWNAPAAQSATWYFYLVAHNNLLTGCTSGGDCTTPPVFIGACVATDLSVNPCTVHWMNWGRQAIVSPDIHPTSYDLLAVASDSGVLATDMPAAPTGTGNYAIATGLSPATVCTIQAHCSYLANIAPASLASYTVPSVLLSSSKRYCTSVVHLPGAVAMSCAGGSANPSQASAQYYGASTCINSLDYQGSRWVAIMPQPTYPAAFPCPGIIAPWSATSFTGCQALSVTGTANCGGQAYTNVFSTFGLVTMLSGATTVTVKDQAVQPWSKISVTEDPLQGTALGVSCPATGDTFSVTAKTPMTSFVITSSGSTPNIACLRFTINNGPGT